MRRIMKISLLLQMKAFLVCMAVIPAIVAWALGQFSEDTIYGIIGAWLMLSPNMLLVSSLLKYSNFQKTLGPIPVTVNELSRSVIINCMFTAAACSFPFSVILFFRIQWFCVLFFLQMTFFLYNVYLYVLSSKKSDSLSAAANSRQAVNFLLMIVQVIVFVAAYDLKKPLWIFVLLFGFLISELFLLPGNIKKTKGNIRRFFFVSEVKADD